MPYTQHSNHSDTSELKPDTQVPVSGARFGWGLFILITGFVSPLAIPFINASDLPDTWKVTLAGVLLVGVPELFILLAAAIMGKSGYEQFKTWLMRFINKYGPADTVSPLRHKLGVCLFAIPLLIGFLAPYVRGKLPWFAGNEVYIAFATDILLLISLLVLGGEFWDKLHGLFFRKARITWNRDSGG